jgi:hypothetical protein
VLRATTIFGSLLTHLNDDDEVEIIFVAYYNHIIKWPYKLAFLADFLVANAEIGKDFFDPELIATLRSTSDDPF